MQANPQQSGQLQNVHGKEITPGDGSSSIMVKNVYQQCLPPHSANPGHTTAGNYLTKVTCTITPTKIDQTGSVQAAKYAVLAPTNQFNSQFTLPPGNQNSPIILWKVPSNSQIFLPVHNINPKFKSTNNGPNVSHCAFTSNSSLYVQPQSTSLPAVPNNSQQVKAQTVSTKGLNEARRNVNTVILNNRQQHSHAPINVIEESTKTKLTSDARYNTTTEHVSQSSLIGGCHYQVLVPETLTHASYVHNISTQRAVAVVTPLSPVGVEPVDASDESANVKTNVTSVQETLEVNSNMRNQTGDPNNPVSMHPQRPKSAEQRLSDGCGAERPTMTNCHRLSKPELKSVAPEQKKSRMQEEPSENINICTIAEKKTFEVDAIPVIEWPLDRLQSLTNMIHQIDDELQKNVKKCDAGRDILKLYWDGDFLKFYDAVQTGIYSSIMEEAYDYCQESVILRQIKKEARNRVINDFHLLKHNEEPPKMTYRSSWLNLNENVDDIDKECGYSWFYRSCQNATELDQNSADKIASELQKAAEMPSLKSTEVENKVSEQPTMDYENINTKLPTSSLPASAAISSSKPDCVVTEQYKSQKIITNPLPDTITVVKGLHQQDGLSGMAKNIGSSNFIGQSDCTNYQKLNSAHQQEEMANNDVMNVRCRTLSKPSQELPLYTNEVETNKMDVSASKMNETTTHCIGSENAGAKVVAAMSQTKHETLINVPRDLEAKSTVEQMGMQKLEEEAKNSARLQKFAEQIIMEKLLPYCSFYEQSPTGTNIQASTLPSSTNSLNGMTSMVRKLKQQEASLKYKKQSGEKKGLKRKHKPSSPPSRLKGSISNGARSPTASKPVQEISVTSTEKDIMTNVLPHKTAQQCFGNAITTQPKASLQTSQDIDMPSTKEHRSIERSGKTDVNCSLEEQTNSGSKAWSYDGPPDIEMDASASFLINVLPHEVAKQCFAGQFIDEGTVVLQKQSDSEIPPKLYPVVTESSQTLNKSIAEMPLIEESVSCKTDPSPELDINPNKGEINKTNALDSIQISVLSHEMAELWFAGEMEKKDLNKDIEVPVSTKHQDEVQDLELHFNKDLEDAKSKRKYPSSASEKLDSFCCLAKWFQTLEYENDSLCLCQEKAKLGEKEIQLIHNSSLDVPKTKEDPNGCTSEATEDSEMEKVDGFQLPKDPAGDQTNIQDVSRSEEVCEEQTETSEQNCVTLKQNELEQENQVPGLKRKTINVSLTLYGSSLERRREVMPTKRYKGAENCEEPPETLQISVSSNKAKVKMKSNKLKVVESEGDYAVGSSGSFKNPIRCKTLPSKPVPQVRKNALSSTSIKKLFSPSTNANINLSEGNRKRQKCPTQQISMNKFVIRGNNMASKMLHSLESIPKSKYELGNPALMPLEDGPSLEFKVLPESFNFQDGAELDISLSTQNVTSMHDDDDEAKKMKSEGSITQGVWSFSPLKKKCTQSNQAIDVAGPCSLFQEFKKKYREKKEIASKKNVNSR